MQEFSDKLEFFNILPSAFQSFSAEYFFNNRGSILQRFFDRIHLTVLKHLDKENDSLQLKTIPRNRKIQNSNHTNQKALHASLPLISSIASRRAPIDSSINSLRTPSTSIQMICILRLQILGWHSRAYPRPQSVTLNSHSPL